MLGMFNPPSRYLSYDQQPKHAKFNLFLFLQWENLPNVFSKLTVDKRIITAKLSTKNTLISGFYLYQFFQQQFFTASGNINS